MCTFSLPLCRQVGLEPTNGIGRNRWWPTWTVGDDSAIGVHTLLAVWADPHGPTSPNSVMLPWCAMPRHAALPRGPSALGSPSSRWRMPTAHALIALATEIQRQRGYSCSPIDLWGDSYLCSAQDAGGWSWMVVDARALRWAHERFVHVQRTVCSWMLVLSHRPMRRFLHVQRTRCSRMLVDARALS